MCRSAEVGTGLGHDVAHLDLLVFGQQAGLDDDLQHLVAHSSPDGGNVKAAGGISTVEDIEKFLDLGADRLGTSRAVKLLTSGEAGSGY